MSYIQFLGAAGTVTGSKHLLNVSGHAQGEGLQALIDCGMFQGPKEWRERNWRDLPIDPRKIESVILTHAHLDHCGWIPRLVKEGFRGRIYATPPTIDLCGIILPDSGYLQEEDAAFHNKKKTSKHTPALPLYTFDEAKQSLNSFSPVEFGKTISFGNDLSFRFVHAAHILGSAMTEVTIRANGQTKLALFTGDIGRVRNSHIAPGKVVHSGPTEGESPDVLVMESTYGNRVHPTNDPRPELARLISQTVHRGGSVIVPAFAVERTQKFLFLLKELMEAGQVPRVPVFADSPMAIEAVEIFLKHSEEFSDQTKQMIAKYGSPLTWPNFTFARTAAESKKINDCNYPCIIVSSNGMAMGGRIQHHLLQRLPDHRNLILFIGFQAVGTRGRQIKDGEQQVKIFGQVVPVRAQTAALEQFSDHADTAELLQWLRTFKKAPEVTYLVHGEPDSAQALKQAIEAELRWPVEIAQYMQQVTVK
ncbi:MAG TPA: MBL fold metallo-hydrolase [Terriglobales bacterium]|nr:MBL fold metallo-hydrolase [Terriglobales bacterium]